MGLMNELMHELDPEYGYGMSNESVQARKQKEKEWQANWRAAHLIRVLFGTEYVECSLYVEVKEEKEEHPYHFVDHDVYSYHGPGEYEEGGGLVCEMLARVSTRVIPVKYLPNDVSFDCDHDTIECFLVWSKKMQAFVPDERFRENLSKKVNFIRKSNPIEIDGEIYYFPIKNKTTHSGRITVQTAEAHVNGQIFPVYRTGTYSFNMSPWRLGHYKGMN